MDQLKQASLQSYIDESEARTPSLGVEKVNGVEAEVYTFVPRQGGGLPIWAVEGGSVRVWIAKDDHRPLKVEQKQSYRDRLNPKQTHANIDTATYAFDPGVEVALPGAP